MDLPLGIKPLPIKKFTNVHNNFTQHLQPGASFDLTVSDPAFKKKYPGFIERYNQTTKNIQWLIDYALKHKIRLRPMGSGWSFSKVGVTEDGIINTKKLRLKARLSKDYVAKEYLEQGGDPTNLLFTQCGNTVIAINNLLEQRRQPAKSLRASGGSNGQTIVGAFSTGTHGAAYRFGAISEMVMGMHIVTGPDTHVWLERKSRPVTSENFRKWMNAEVIQDDELFDSALQSFGSFGFIHGVLIEVEPIFLLEQQQIRIPYDQGLEKAILQGDFSDIARHLKYSNAEIENTLYHFELAINPYDFEKNDPEKGAYIRLMYKLPYREDYTPIRPESEGYTYGDYTLGLIQQVLDKVEKAPGKLLDIALIPLAVKSLFNQALDRPVTAIGTVGETFHNTRYRGNIFSAAYAFDQKDIPKVIDLILKLNKESPFAGAIAMRFVKGTEATLGFTRFNHSCVLELDGVDAVINHKFVEQFTQLLEQDNLEYTIHWGKINKVIDAARLRRMYGPQRVEKWLAHRRQLLNEQVREVFNNNFLQRCGLD
jgi:hypothetical protein